MKIRPFPIIWIGSLLLLALLPLASHPAVAAEPLAAQPPAPAAVQPPAQVEELARLLQDPAVRGWLRDALAQPATDAAIGEPATAAVPASGTAQDAAPSAIEAETFAALTRLRAHRQTIVTALPRLPGAIGDAIGRLGQEMAGWGVPVVILSIVVFAGCGLGAEWIFLRQSRRIRRKVLDASERTIGERLRKAGLRLSLALLSIVIFAAFSLGPFLLFDWPPMFRQVAARFLLAAVLFRLGRVLGRFLLAPTLPKLRIIPMDSEDAHFRYRRWSILLGIFVFGWATAGSLRVLGLPPPMPTVVAYLFGLALLATTLEACWRRRRAAVDEAAADGDLSDMPSIVPTVFFTIYATLVYLLWLQGAMKLFWLALLAGLLPAAVRVTQRAVDNILRPVGTEISHAPSAPPSVTAAIVERGARTFLIVAAALVIVWAWDIDLSELGRAETGSGRLFAALLSIVLILLLTDFLWHVAKTAIDGHIAGAALDPHDPQPLDEGERRRRGRVQTLLPIFRNILFVFLLITAILMGLSALGVQIAPLLAGAGVIGVAVGFGSQTLVRDIMSGMFYLLDDAFRVGEYIVAGPQKGTVESFSLRSIKLRHHRGPLFTVPFGSLGAIQNLSRDWVIDKIMMNVTYDTDLAKVKKVIKQVSAEIMADPELAQGILEPLKSQGVFSMGDFAIRIRMKIMCKPGQQFAVRRVIYDKIKTAFAANNIKFGLPIVNVGGGGDTQVAAAQQVVEMISRPAAE
jgi:small-conductance mechanosensitive channel